MAGFTLAWTLVAVGPARGAGAQVPPAPGGARVTLVSQPSWVRPGERFDVRVRVTGAPADAALRLVVHGATDSRAAFRRTLEGDLGRVVSSGAPVPVAELPAAAGGTVTAGFLTGGGGVDLTGRGVYPVEVQLVAAGGQELDGVVTYLDYLTGLTPEFPPLDVAVVLDVGGGQPVLQPDGHPLVAAEALTRARERLSLLDETTAVPVTVAPEPETLDGFAAAGGDATAVVEDLRTTIAGRPVLARPYVDVDLAALRRAGLLDEARDQVDSGTLAEQSRLRVTPVAGIWLSGATLGSEAARALGPLGFGRALVPPAALEHGEDGSMRVPKTPVQLGSDGPVAMVTDPALAEHLTGGTGVLGAQRFLAELAITWLEAPANRRGVVVRIPADAEIDPAAVAVALNGLRDGQAVTAVPLDQLFANLAAGDRDPEVVDLADHGVDHDLRPVADQLRIARAGLDGLNGLVGDPAQTASRRRSLLISTGVATPDETRPLYIGQVTGALGSVEGAVVLPEKFRITLTSRSSTIPVTVTNNTDRELSVMVQVDSDQLEFPDGRLIATPLPANTTTRLDLPVRVRTSGAFTMDVQVTSPDGTIVLDRSTFDVRSTAISGVGLILSGGAALFLAVWWLRHWRSTRRSRHLMPRGAVPFSPAAADAAGTAPDRPDANGGDARPPPGAGTPDETDPGYRPAHLAGERARRPARQAPERASRPH